MNYQDNKLNPNEILNKMQELEQKYNRGDENGIYKWRNKRI